MEYYFYLDSFLLLNTIIDFIGVTTTAICCNKKIYWKKVLSGCTAASISSLILFLVLRHTWSYKLITHVLLNPALILWVFGKDSLLFFFRELCTCYLVILMIGGFQSAWFAGGGIRSPIYLVGMAVIIAVLYGVYQRRGKMLKKLCQIELYKGDEVLQLKGLWDTGNLLKDPYTGKPVCVMQKWGIDLAYLTPMERVISYTTIQGNSDSMELFAAEKMIIYENGREIQIIEPVIGKAENTFMEHLKIQILISPYYLGND